MYSEIQTEQRKTKNLNCKIRAVVKSVKHVAADARSLNNNVPFQHGLHLPVALHRHLFCWINSCAAFHLRQLQVCNINNKIGFGTVFSASTAANFGGQIRQVGR